MDRDLPEYLRLLRLQQIHTAQIATPVLRFPGLRSADAAHAQNLAYGAALSALFQSKFEDTLSKTTADLGAELEKNAERFQALTVQFGGKVNAAMRAEFAQFRALALCHSIDLLAAQIKRDVDFSRYKKRGMCI